MYRAVHVSVIGIAAVLVCGSPASPAEITRTIFGVDISGSSTFLVDQGSAEAAGAFVEKHVAGLDAPHELRMVSIGDTGLARRVIDVRATVTNSRASSARTLAPQFGGYFRGLPAMAESGRIAPQDTTSLVAFFQSLKPACAVGNTTVIVFSDGVEWSATVDGRAFVAGQVSLPKPEGMFLTGCSVTLLGVGSLKSSLNSDALEQRLIPQWETFLADAGADAVVVTGGLFGF